MINQEIKQTRIPVLIVRTRVLENLELEQETVIMIEVVTYKGNTVLSRMLEDIEGQKPEVTKCIR